MIEFNKIKEVEQEIEKFFNGLNIQLGDSVQILNEYFYIELINKVGAERKFRIPYPKGLNHFLEMNKGERLIFILTTIIVVEFGE